MYLLDTVTISEPTKRLADARVLRWLAERRDQDLFISVLTLGEIQRGVHRLPQGARKDQLASWAAGLPPLFGNRVLPVDLAVAHEWAMLTSGATAGDRQALTIDTLLAATAQARGLVMVTRNVADFGRLGIPVVNPWDAPA